MSSGNTGILPAAALIAALGAAAACGTGDAAIPALPTEQRAEVDAEASNIEGALPGKVMALAESDGRVFVFGDKGAATFVLGGGLTFVEEAHEWTSAASFTGLDGTSAWAVGVTRDGRVLRVRDDSFEDVGWRFGLGESERAVEVASIDPTHVAFVTAESVVVADLATKSTRRYDTGPLTRLATRGTRIAGIREGSVVVLDTSVPAVVVHPVPDAVATAFDADGRLLAIARDRVHREDAVAGGLGQLYVHDAATLGSSSSSPVRTWVTAANAVLVVDAHGAKRVRGLDAGGDSVSVLASPNGDAWVAGTSLVRVHLTEAPATGTDDLWIAQVLPVYESVCRACHAPSGSAGIDLSTRAAWMARRGVIRERVLEKKQMPPPPRSLSADQLGAIQRWLDSEP
jgi:mono/diheme cytochrome c family protein